MPSVTKVEAAKVQTINTQLLEDSFSAEIKKDFNRFLDTKDTAFKIELIDKVVTKISDINDEVRNAKVVDETKTNSLKQTNRFFVNYFANEFSKAGLKLNSYSDFEKFFVKHVSNNDFYPLLFIYVMTHLDTKNSNVILQKPEVTFNRKQGDCDDISILVKKLSDLRGIKDGNVYVNFFKDSHRADSFENRLLSGHVRFVKIEQDVILLFDNAQYIKLNRKQHNLDSYRDVVKKFESNTSHISIVPDSMLDKNLDEDVLTKLKEKAESVE